MPCEVHCRMHVLKQSVVSVREKSYDNWFYKIELSKLQCAYLQAKDEGVGVIIQAKGRKNSGF